MAKDLESLKESRKLRAQFIQDMGGVLPTSILRWTGTDTYKETPLLGLERRNTDVDLKLRQKQRARGINEKVFSTSGKVCRGKEGYLSVFPQNIGRMVTKFYCPPGGTVYDPFHGHNSRMQLCYESGFNYVGVDVSINFHKACLEIRDRLLKRNKHGFVRQKNTITLYNQSSASVPQVDDASADYTITSPPYWDVEYYGDEAEQLGNCKTYARFLSCLGQHVQENYRVLKPGSFAIWFVNDFVKDKIYYPYHADLITLFTTAGFALHNVNIVDLGRSLEACFVQSIIAKKRFPKQHEFCMIFRKD